MRERDFYPAGSFEDTNAPWNEVEVPEIELNVEVGVCLVKKDVTVMTDNYIFERDEDGYEGYELLDSYEEVKDCYEAQCFTIPELLEELAKYIKGELLGDIGSARKQELEQMLEDCTGWEQQDIDIEDFKVK